MKIKALNKNIFAVGHTPEAALETLYTLCIPFLVIGSFISYVRDLLEAGGINPNRAPPKTI